MEWSGVDWSGDEKKIRKEKWQLCEEKKQK